MSVQGKKSLLAAKYGTAIQKAVEAHKDDPIDYGRIDLPPGILNGRAQLNKCYFSEYKSGDNKGEVYFYASGIVCEPKEVAVQGGSTVEVRGQITKITIPVCATSTKAGKETTQEQHIAEILNEMKKLGYEFGEKVAVDELEIAAKALEDAAPYFKFRTSAGTATPEYPNPRTFENWLGNKGLEDYTPPSEDDVVEPASSSNGQLQKPDTVEPQTEEVQASDSIGDHELDELTEKATNNDEEAGAKMIEIAVAHGIERTTAETTLQWSDLAELIREARDHGVASPEEEEAAPTGPTAGDVGKYQLVDVKGKPALGKDKKPIPPIDVEIVAVDDDKGVLVLKSVKDSKIYRNVKIDKFIVA